MPWVPYVKLKVFIIYLLIGASRVKYALNCLVGLNTKNHYNYFYRELGSFYQKLDNEIRAVTFILKHVIRYRQPSSEAYIWKWLLIIVYYNQGSKIWNLQWTFRCTKLRLLSSRHREFQLYTEFRLTFYQTWIRNKEKEQRKNEKINSQCIKRKLSVLKNEKINSQCIKRKH